MAESHGNPVQYHNVAVYHNTQYYEYEHNFNIGERFRLAGLMKIYLDRDHHSERTINEFNEAQKSANYQIDSWARIYRKTLAGGTVSIEFDNIHGMNICKEIDQTALKAMIIEGQKREAARIALESGIAWQAHQENLSPRYEPTALKQLHENGLLGVGTDLVIDGVNCGIITDYIADDGNILVKTDRDDCLYSTVDFRNEYNKLSNPCYYKDDALLSVKAKEPVDEETVLSFILDNHEELPLIESDRDKGIRGSVMAEEMFENKNFIKTLGFRIADYMERNNVQDILNTSNKQVIGDLVEMIKCEMVDQGYYSIPKEKPSQQALEYLQSLGYTETAMAEKADVLARWLNDKNLTEQERVVAQSIVDGKVLHVLKDIDKDSIREKTDFPLIDVYRKVEDYAKDKAIYYMMASGGKCRATHINLALGTQEECVVKLPYFEYKDRSSIGRWDSDMQIGSTDKDIYVTFDISEEYQKLGGFDYNLALEQTMGKSQKQDEPEVTNQDQQEIEEETPVIGENR